MYNQIMSSKENIFDERFSKEVLVKNAIYFRGPIGQMYVYK